MTGNERRNKIIEMLNSDHQAISASTFAKMFGVSRQIIVGDIALLRATGHQISAVNTGYIINLVDDTYKSHQVIVKHNPADTKKELLELISCGVIIKDVTINHPLYGLLKGELNIKDRDDVLAFLNDNPNLLSSLTDGVHVHTLLYKDDTDLENALLKLKSLGFYYED